MWRSLLNAGTVLNLAVTVAEQDGADEEDAVDSEAVSGYNLTNRLEKLTGRVLRVEFDHAWSKGG